MVSHLMCPNGSYLPPYSAAPVDANKVAKARNRKQAISCLRRSSIIAVACLVAFVVVGQWGPTTRARRDAPGMNLHGLSLEQLQRDRATCSKLHTTPVDPIGVGREKNARYIDGHPPTLIKNASVWVGEPLSDDHYTWVAADVLLEHGLITRVDRGLKLGGTLLSQNTLIYDAAGRPLTSGIIDLHSHAGVHSLPTIHSNDDTSELSSNIAPYVRSIDGIQPTDWQLQVIKSGGVTASLVLPGSGNNIGGEAFVIKHVIGHDDGRNETSVTDMLADRSWRHIKMACGENPKRVHGKAGEHGPTSRLGQSWELRQALEQASTRMRIQDDWCNAAKTTRGLESTTTYLPMDLEWEPLIGVLRGQVHVHVHCYTIPDLETFVDHTNEFNFSVRAFHHAHQAYLVPETLKRAWGSSPPASALFADNMWYKAEAYIGSEYAGKYLHDSGLVPIYVSDNPILNAQHLVSEAGKGYRYGLPYHVALAAVTTSPAERLGLGNQLGKIKRGFDADVVLWDSDPLSVGATPVQVWIDGTAQYETPVELAKPLGGSLSPELSNIVETPFTLTGKIVFTGVIKDFLTTGVDKRPISAKNESFIVAVNGGKITCIGQCRAELRAAPNIIHLKNGYLTPAGTAFGSTLGLNTVDSERNTDNGADGEAVFSRAIDALAFDTTKLHVAHRYGITRAISAPTFLGGATHHGTSAGFLTSASTALTPNISAVFATDVALHYTLSPSVKHSGSTPSISAALGQLRHKLIDAVLAFASQVRPTQSTFEQAADIPEPVPSSESAFLQQVVAGEKPLAVTVHSADTIAALLRVKADVDKLKSSRLGGLGGGTIRLVIIGGAEAHLLGTELAAAEVGVFLSPMQSFAVSWDQRRALTGAPLTNGTTIDALIDAGVLTAIGLEEDWILRDLGLVVATAYRNGEGKLDEIQALDLISRNVYRILGLDEPQNDAEEHFVLYEGSPLEIHSRIKGVGSGIGRVDIF